MLPAMVAVVEGQSKHRSTLELDSKTFQTAGLAEFCLPALDIVIIPVVSTAHSGGLREGSMIDLA